MGIPPGDTFWTANRSPPVRGVETLLPPPHRANHLNYARQAQSATVLPMVLLPPAFPDHRCWLFWSGAFMANREHARRTETASLAVIAAVLIASSGTRRIDNRSGELTLADFKRYRQQRHGACADVKARRGSRSVRGAGAKPMDKSSR